MVQGLTSTDIAQRLFLSISIVYQHIKTIIRNVGADNRAGPWR